MELAKTHRPDRNDISRLECIDKVQAYSEDGEGVVVFVPREGLNAGLLVAGELQDHLAMSTS